MTSNNPLGLSFFIKQQASYSRVQALLRMLFGQVYILIPHGLVLLFVGIWGSLLQVFAFWAILFTRKYPKSWFEFQVNLLRWKLRVNARMMHLTDGYPAFGLSKQDPNIIFEVEYPEELSRGKLLLKLFFGFFLIIPHAFCLFFRAIATLFLVILTPWSILFTGNYPAGWHRFNVGTLRWAARVGLYFGLMRDEYPPFYGKTTQESGEANTTNQTANITPETQQKTVLVRKPDGSIVKKIVDESTYAKASSDSSSSKNPSAQSSTIPASSLKTETMTTSKEEKKKNKSLLIVGILAFLLFLGTLFLFFKYYNLDKQYAGLLSEKSYNEERFESTLDSLQTLINNLNSEALMLRDQIEHPEKNEKYKGLMDEYNSLKLRLGQLQSGGGNSPKLKKEIAELKARIQQLEQEIIAFKAQISGLEMEKTQLTADVADNKRKADDYKNESARLQNQIDEAAKLDFEDIISGGIKYKSEEKKKDKPKAKSLNKIQVCFSIAANKIAKPGARDIYVRIITPTGQVLKRGEQSVTINGESLAYSIQKTQQYSNKEELVCMYYDKNDDKLEKGDYSVEIYAEDRLVGKSAFTLK